MRNIQLSKRVPSWNWCVRVERPLARRLDEIVRFDGGAGQAAGETPEPGQDGDELVVETTHSPPHPPAGAGRIRT